MSRRPESIPELTQVQLDHFRFLINFFANSEEGLSPDRFFGLALYDAYDTLVSPLGIAPVAGHIIYRLSDFVDEDQRRTIVLYPNSTGSVIDNGESCDSLEDWRVNWISIYKDGIPPLSELWPEGSGLLPFTDSSK